MHLGRLLWHLGWCLLALFASLAGASGLTLSGNESQVPLASALEMFDDPSGTMTIVDASRLTRFKRNPDLLRPGRTSSAIWLKLHLVNQSASPLTRWLEIQPNHVREASFYQQQDGVWRDTQAGTAQPFDERLIPATSPVFPVSLSAGEEKTVYIRIASSLPLAISPTLWTPEAFRVAENRRHLKDGLMLGSFAFMALLGFVLLFMLGDRAFLFNALATVTYFFGELSAKGYGFMYVWPHATEWVVRCLPLYALLGVGFNLLFLRSLLGTRQRFPRIDRLLLGLVVTEWVMAPGVLFGHPLLWASLSFPQHFPITVVMVTVGIYAVMKGIRAARYYVVGYALLAVGSLMHLLGSTGILVHPDPGSYALPIGMLLNNLLLFLSAVERVLQVRKEKEAAQAALLAAQAAYQAELEQTVEQRTADLNAALVETRKTNESQARLLSYVGHDLRAPLASIVNYSSQLEHHQDPEVQRYRATVACSALYQLELIDDLIEYTRGQLHHTEYQPIPTDLPRWLDHIVEQAELLATQQNNRFLLEAVNTPPAVYIDPDRLRQVLINLLINASKFTHDGAIRLRFQSRLRADGEVELNFAIDDTGAGISKYDMERVFQPFGRTNSQRDESGLGLAIARQLVSSMGGELKANSAPGIGSSFNFRLTVKTASKEAVTEDGSFSKAFGAGKSLLIADGNRASRSYLREVASSAGFDVTCVGDGQEALQLAQEREFSAIIVDQFLPGLDGWQLLRQLRTAGPTSRTPIILCSSMRPQKPAGFEEDINFEAALLKPVPAEMLLRVIAAQIKSFAPSLVTAAG